MGHGEDVLGVDGRLKKKDKGMVMRIKVTFSKVIEKNYTFINKYHP